MWKYTLTQKPAHIYSSLKKKKKTSKTWKQQRWLSLGKCKPTVVHPDYGILFSVKKKQVFKPWKDIVET